MYLAAGITNLIGTMFLVAGLIGVIHLLRRRRVTLGQIGAGLLLLGTLALAATYVINVMEIETTDAKYDRAQMVEFFESTEESARAAPTAILAAALIGIGLRILAVSDDDWERWQVLPDQGEEAAQAQQPVRTPG